MNSLYTFAGVSYIFDGGEDPILASALQECKTKKERAEILKIYQTILIGSILAALFIAACVLGVVAFFTGST